ncbi:hypothetical protein LNN38_21380 [Pseudomonas sp. LA21]|uniref:hypothetical protein n=1 Tax=Pseudomonas sp. LA21 TaxID=2893373 RepID=UPI001FB85D4D|nr:hypothetical protein [Pseudomonas sp. LA21]MCJ1887427.1 hypothetical protein [Pseudomonas sp. LA21]
MADIRTDLNSLQVAERKQRALRSIEPRGARAAIRGRSSYSAPSASGGGIASPLIEVSTEYWPDGWPSTDGLFVLPAPKRKVFTDANGDEAVFMFSDPGAA